MKIFGTVQPIIESREASFKMGRLVANYEFFKALLKHSDFDEFHIFCPTYANCKQTEGRILREDTPRDRTAQVRIFHIASLKKLIAQNTYHVFHVGGWGFFFPGLIYLRNIHAPKPFPVTGITHSLNGQRATVHALKICSAPTLPFDSVICTSNCGKKVLEGLLEATEKNFSRMNIKYRGRMDIIPLGIDDAYKTIPDKRQSRKSLGIDDDAFVILTLGRLTPEDKMDFAPFVSAVKRFTEKNKDKKIVLIIAGGADNLQRTLITDIVRKAQLEDITKLFINFEDDKKTFLYSAADIYAAPVDNLQETFGLSVVEAMAHECAVVVSDFNGYSELVDHNVNGIKIPTFWANALEDFEDVSEIINFPTYQLILCQSIAVDLDKMLEAFQQLLDNPEKRTALAKAAREKVAKKYFWSDIIKQYCALWDELSQQAQNSSIQVEKPKNPWEIDFWSIFSHYPSNIVSNDSTISLSRHGMQFLKSGSVPPSYSDIAASILLPKLLASGLKLLEQNPLKAEQFTTSLKKHATISDSRALYYLLWMAKYNLITIED